MYSKYTLEVAVGDSCRAKYQGKKYAVVIVAKGITLIFDVIVRKFVLRPHFVPY